MGTGLSDEWRFFQAPTGIGGTFWVGEGSGGGGGGGGWCVCIGAHDVGWGTRVARGGSGMGAKWGVWATDGGGGGRVGGKVCGKEFFVTR